MRGGIARIKGYPEFTTPSVPPKFYRRKNLGGAITYCTLSTTDLSCPSGDGGIETGSVTNTLDTGHGFNTVTLTLTGATFVRANVVDGQIWTLNYHYEIVNGGGCTAPGGPGVVSGTFGWVAYSDTGSASGDLSVDVAFPLAGAVFSLNSYPLGPGGGHTETLLTVAPKTLKTGVKKAYSGFNSIDDSGVETIGGQVAVQDLGDSCSGGSGGVVSSIGSVISTETFISPASVTKTTRSQSGEDGCHSGSGGYDLLVSGTRVESLASEDTEGAAITRLLAGIPVSPFETAPFCCAAWQPRIDGDGFVYNEAEYQVTVDGTPGANVRVIVSFSRRPFGVGAYVPYLELPILIQIGSDGKGHYEGTVENTRGYQTCYTSCRLE